MSQPPTHLRFLVVDDNEDIRDLLVRMVERLGHAADQASDGVEATERLQENRYDMMLLDLTMPRMGGEDVVRWVNEHPDRGEGLEIVIVSARTESEFVARSLRAGASDYVTKPFQPSELVRRVRRVLGKAGAAV